MRVDARAFYRPLIPFHELEAGTVFATVSNDRIEEFYLAVRGYGVMRVEYGARLGDGVLIVLGDTQPVYVIDAKAVLCDKEE